MISRADEDTPTSSTPSCTKFYASELQLQYATILSKPSSSTKYKNEGEERIDPKFYNVRPMGGVIITEEAESIEIQTVDDEVRHLLIHHMLYNLLLYMYLLCSSIHIQVRQNTLFTNIFHQNYIPKSTPLPPGLQNSADDGAPQRVPSRQPWVHSSNQVSIGPLRLRDRLREASTETVSACPGCVCVPPGLLSGLRHSQPAASLHLGAPGSRGLGQHLSHCEWRRGSRE